MATRGRDAPAEFGKTVAAIIDNARTDQGISQAALGKKVGISQPQLSDQLSGRKPLTLDEFRALCLALDLSTIEVVQLSES
jgi:transcriptional regulator with XRE-family HTH domain